MRFYTTTLIAGLASLPALAQPVRLDLRIVPQIGTPATSVVDTTASMLPPPSGPGQAIRFEVQYRIVDLDVEDLVLPAGLRSAIMNISTTGLPTDWTLRPAALSQEEANLADGAPPPTTDSSGPALPTADSANPAGLHHPFRGALPGPVGTEYNGHVAAAPAAINGIRPLSNAPNDQGVLGPFWYGLYSFDVVAGSGAFTQPFTLTAELVPTPPSTTRFTYFDDGGPVALASSNATPGSVTINPPATTFGCCTGAACTTVTQASACIGGTVSSSCAVAGAGWPPGRCCQADVNHTGALTVQDLFEFLALFFGNDPRGDFNNSGGFSSQDLFDFLAAYFRGCP